MKIFSAGELRDAFETVQNPKDPKGPIDARINPVDREIIRAAIVHFTDFEPTFIEDAIIGLRVTSPGYRDGMNEELDAAARYARQYGRTWKTKLADHWARETLNPPKDRRDAPLLRSIRNHPRYNLEWLNKIATKDLVKRLSTPTAIDEVLHRLTVETRDPTKYLLINEGDGTRWRGSIDGWKRDDAAEKIAKPNPVDIHIGGRIAAKRKEIDPDASRFASRLGIPEATLADWEAGRARVGAGALYSLSMHLQVSVGYFFKGL